MKKQIIRCPYCGSVAVLRDASYVYKNVHSSKKKVYVCSRFPACDSYVSVHPGTNMPRGTLANKELRSKRIKAHRTFDQIWRSNIMTRYNAYKWLADSFGLNSKQAHIAQFSDYMCEQIIKESNRVLSNNHVSSAA